LGKVLEGRDFKKGEAKKHTFEDDGYQEEPEESVSHLLPNEMVQNAVTYINEVLAKGEPFKDEEFPPVFESYSRANEETLKPNIDGDFAKASDLIENLGLFKRGPSYDDIKQGGIGNAYLLSAISSLAEIPSNVKVMFLNKTYNKCGIYGVIFYLNGEPTPVIVDDYFMFSDDGEPNFA